MERRSIRIISFGMAALLTLLGFAGGARFKADHYRRQVELGYYQSLQEAAAYLNDAAIELQKAAYAGTPAQTVQLSAYVYRDTSGAKAALSRLPVAGAALEDANRFLSQTGEYALYLQSKAVLHQDITEEDMENLDGLADCTRELGAQLAGLEQLCGGDGAALEDLLSMGFSAQPAARSLNDSGDVSFSNAPLSREPQMTKDKETLSRNEALLRAAQFAGASSWEMGYGTDEDSSMPSYSFHTGTMDILVTKEGGYISCLLDAREVGERTLTAGEARDAARRYLEGRDIGAVQETRYEIANGVCTVSYAHTSQDVLCYPDLIKVGVGMDTGGVVMFDSRAYLANHCERTFPSPVLTGEQAADVLNPSLRPQGCQLAVIPSAGGGEVLTYEFLCESERGDRLLVYVDANTGAEEEIFLLLETENGVLTV